MLSFSAGNHLFDFNKSVVSPGLGIHLPNEFSTCQILIHCASTQEGCDLSTQIGYPVGHETSIVVGHGSTWTACVIDLCLQTMRSGERCMLMTTLVGNRDTTMTTVICSLDLQLLSFERVADIHAITTSEKLARAVALKEIGISAFRSSDVSTAFYKFSRALKYLVCVDYDNIIVGSCAPSGDTSKMLSLVAAAVQEQSDAVSIDAMSTEVTTMPPPTMQVEPSDAVMTMTTTTAVFLKEDCNQLAVQCRLNLAACQLRHNNFEMARANCSCVLNVDANNVKGLFRRAQCSLRLGDEHSAVADLQHALVVDPDNREVARLLRTSKEASRRSDEKLASAMSKMFR